MEDVRVEVVGDLNPKQKFCGHTRQQNFVIGTGGVSMAITAKHKQHEFSIMEKQVLGWTRDEKGNVVKRPPVEVANTVTSGKRDNTQNYVVEPAMMFKGREIQNGDGLYLSDSQDFFRGGLPSISRALKSECCDAGVCDNYRIRKLTERECFRLMGLNDGEIDKIQAAGISRSQQSKLAGNSIVVNCLAAIFRQLFIGNENKNQQLEIF